MRLDEDALSTSQIDAAFAPDGSGVWFLSDRDSNIRTLRFRKLEDGSVRDFTLGKIAWEIQQFAVSNNGGTIALVANEDGYDRLYMLDVRRNRLTPAPANIAETATRIHSMRFSPDDRRLALSLASPSMPGDVFTLDVRSQKLERWTRSELGSLRYTDLGKPELIHYATFDIDAKTGQRRLIPAFYYKPKGFSGARPVVIQIHGGPESQFRPTFNPLLHYLVNDLGIAVVAPNVRGSSGYGRDWLALDDVFKREDAVRDIGGLLDWIGTRPELDHRRVGVMGGSYGGYMVLASMIQFPQRLKGGVSLVGISNFITFLETPPANTAATCAGPSTATRPTPRCGPSWGASRRCGRPSASTPPCSSPRAPTTPGCRPARAASCWSRCAKTSTRSGTWRPPTKATASAANPTATSTAPWWPSSGGGSCWALAVDLPTGDPSL